MAVIHEIYDSMISRSEIILDNAFASIPPSDSFLSILGLKFQVPTSYLQIHKCKRGKCVSHQTQNRMLHLQNQRFGYNESKYTLQLE